MAYKYHLIGKTERSQFDLRFNSLKESGTLFYACNGKVYLLLGKGILNNNLTVITEEF
jgi:hypothetical protein